MCSKADSLSGWDLLQGRDAIRQGRQKLFRGQLPEVNANTRGRLSWRPLPCRTERSVTAKTTTHPAMTKVPEFRGCSILHSPITVLI
jgi:hypothetical protein